MKMITEIYINGLEQAVRELQSHLEASEATRKSLQEELKELKEKYAKEAETK